MTLAELRPRFGVLALSGYGLRIAVERGHLVVMDGAGRSRRSGRFSRVTPELKRVIICGSSGTITLDALRSLTDTRAHVVQIDHDGRLVTVTAHTRLDDARLRRAQALASVSGVGLELARELIVAKIEAQANTLERMADDANMVTVLRETVSHVHKAGTIERVRYVEARAAFGYWQALASAPLRFPAQHLAKIPEHWRTLGDRHSPLTLSGRKGVTPINSMLNYCYAIAAAEARIACIAAGCDPGLGFLHFDRVGRDSLAFDILEPIRPHVDAFVLGFAREHTFSRGDFFENRDGVCRLLPTITRPLSETASRWAKLLHPIAHRVARRFEQAGAVGFENAHASESRERIKTEDELLSPWLNVRQPDWKAPVEDARAKRLCRSCGASISEQQRVYCANCIVTLPRMATEYAVRALRRRQREESGAGPSQETRELLGDARTQRAKAIRAWEAKHPSVPSAHVFSKEILPLLSDIRAPEIRAVTGLCRSYCGRILRGQYIPHPMHWEAIRKLASRTVTPLAVRR
jgi:CRISPR-associated endonuclease Cas1